MAVYTSSKSTPSLDRERIHEIRDIMHPNTVPQSRKSAKSAHSKHTAQSASKQTTTRVPVAGIRRSKVEKPESTSYYSKK